MIWLRAAFNDILAFENFFFSMVLQLTVLQSISHYSHYFFCLSRRCCVMATKTRARYYSVNDCPNCSKLKCNRQWPRTKALSESTDVGQNNRKFPWLVHTTSDKRELVYSVSFQRSEVERGLAENLHSEFWTVVTRSWLRDCIIVPFIFCFLYQWNSCTCHFYRVDHGRQSAALLSQH